MPPNRHLIKLAPERKSDVLAGLSVWSESPPRGGAKYDTPHMEYDGPIYQAVFLTNLYLGGRG